MRNYTYEQLNVLPTLCVGQADDLKIEGDGRRVWLSRVEHTVTEETWDPTGGEDGRGEWVAEVYEIEFPDGEDDTDEDETETDPSDVDLQEPLVSGQWRLTEMVAALPAGRDVDMSAVQPVEVPSMVPAPYNERTVVTPDIARTMLERYTPLARPLQQERVDHYVRLLTANTPAPDGARALTFDPDGVPLLDEIAISSTGHTVAGQALLHAIVETGVSVETLIRRNHPGPVRLYEDGADPAYVARMVEALNGRNAVEGTRWYLNEVKLSDLAHEDGKLRRVELWHLTDDAARAAGFTG